jgi:hypothetical protein
MKLPRITFESKTPFYTLPKRKVHDIDQTCHVWAQQTMMEGRAGSGRIFFQGRSIYSYGSHFEMARYAGTVTIKGHDKSVTTRRVFLINSDKYSPTTSGHTRSMRQALQFSDMTIGISDLQSLSARSFKGDRATLATISDWFASEFRPFEFGLNSVHNSARYVEAETARLLFADLHKLKLPSVDRLIALGDKQAKARQKASEGKTLANAKRLVLHFAKTPKALATWHGEQVAVIDALDSAWGATRHMSVFKGDALNLHRAMKLLKARDLLPAKVALARQCETALRALAVVAESKGAAINRTNSLWGDRRNVAKHVRALRKNTEVAFDRTEWHAGMTTHNAIRTICEHGLESRYPQIVRLLTRRISAQTLFEDQKTTFRALNPDAQSVVDARQRALYSNRKPVTPEAWLDGASGQLPYDVATLARRKGDNLETSRGAQVPWRDALRLFKVAQEVRLTGETFVPREPILCGHFTLNRIDNDGTLRIACHVIGWQAMQTLAVKEAPALLKPAYPLPVVMT